MQDVYIVYQFEQMFQMAERYEQAFAENEAVTIVDWGCSYKQAQGYMGLEWDDVVDPTFLHQLDSDTDILDYCVYTVPSEKVSSVLKNSATLPIDGQQISILFLQI